MEYCVAKSKLEKIGKWKILFYPDINESQTNLLLRLSGKCFANGYNRY